MGSRHASSRACVLVALAFSLSWSSLFLRSDRHFLSNTCVLDLYCRRGSLRRKKFFFFSSHRLCIQRPSRRQLQLTDELFVNNSKFSGLHCQRDPKRLRQFSFSLPAASFGFDLSISVLLSSIVGAVFVGVSKC
jgi:hypothetical protein